MLSSSFMTAQPGQGGGVGPHVSNESIATLSLRTALVSPSVGELHVPQHVMGVTAH